jgi:hypothetical protein
MNVDGASEATVPIIYKQQRPPVHGAPDCSPARCQKLFQMQQNLLMDWTSPGHFVIKLVHLYQETALKTHVPWHPDSTCNVSIATVSFDAN